MKMEKEQIKYTNILFIDLNMYRHLQILGLFKKKNPKNYYCSTPIVLTVYIIHTNNFEANNVFNNIKIHKR